MDASQQTSLPPLERIRAEFHECAAHDSSTGGKWVSPEALARYWRQLVERDLWQSGRCCLSGLDKQALALRVVQAVQDMDLRCNGRITEDEWLHHMLLLRSGCTMEQVNSLLGRALKRNSSILQDLQGIFEAADTTRCGILSLTDVVAAYRRRRWRLRPKGEFTNLLSDAELNSSNVEKLSREIVQAMDLDGDEHVSYPEFMAYALGRRKQEVRLNFYDLSKGAAQTWAPWVVGHDLEGVWHTGTVVYGREYHYARDTVHGDPGDTSFGRPTRSLHLGFTLWRKDEFHQFINTELKPIFQRDTYDVVCNNCNHFTDRVCMYLLGRHPPEEVLKQPEVLMQSWSVRAIRPVLNWWLRDRIVVREKLPDTSKAKLRRKALRPQEQLPLGSVVQVTPGKDGGPAVLGQVVRQPNGGSSGAGPWSEEARESGSAQGAGSPWGCCGHTTRPSSELLLGPCHPSAQGLDACGMAPGCGCGCGHCHSNLFGAHASQGTWVQSFDVALEMSGAVRGQVRTECLPSSHVSVVSLAESSGQSTYNRAFSAITVGSSLSAPEDRSARYGQGAVGTAPTAPHCEAMFGGGMDEEVVPV